MTVPASARRQPRPAPRLRASPNFVQMLTMDGRPYIAQDTEPYVQYWLTERYRLLLTLFSGRRGRRVDDAIAAWHRLHGSQPSELEDRRLQRAIDDMCAAGVLIGGADDTSRYDRAIVDAYVAHRPFPPEITRHLIERGAIGRTTRVLDLAGGPGDLALALAHASDAVAMMELSRGFVAAASARARAEGVALRTIHDSCNRLLHRDEPWDVISVAQALHWLDDVEVVRGVCRLLQADGSFFVVHSAIELADDHPLAYLLGHDSVLGAKARMTFADEVQPLQRRLALLFEALDTPQVQRADLRQGPRLDGSQRIAAAGVQTFRQRRAFGPGYARGFLTPNHIAVTGMSPQALWADVERRCAGVEPRRLLGTHRWAVLHFRRGARADQVPSVADVAEQEIAPPATPDGPRRLRENA